MSIDELFDKEAEQIKKLMQKQIPEDEILKFDYVRLRIQGTRYYMVRFQKHPHIYLKEKKPGIYVLDSIVKST